MDRWNAGIPSGPWVAVALGGGGARGYAHIGVLEVLRERGYDVAGLAGSSMGAVVGGLFAAGGLDAFSDWVRGLSHRDVLRLYDPARGPGAIRAERIFGRVAGILGAVRIEDLPLPVTAVATDLETGEECWFQDGPVDAAIRASAALPGFMTPVVVDGRLLADGGLTNPLPLAPTAPLAADLTVAVVVSRRTRTPATTRGGVRRFLGPRLAARRGSAEPTAPAPGALPAGLGLRDVVDMSLEALWAASVRHALAAYPPEVLITVPRTACRMLDFHKAGELIELGRRLAVDALDAAAERQQTGSLAFR